MVILLIEPDIRLAGLYRRALEQAEHNVSWARQAQSAVHAADDKKPDLVLLELQLSAHNGIEFLYEFRSYTEWKDIPVILLTMVTPDAILITKSQMESLGIVDILYKPATNLAQLVAAVSDAQ
jgi:DNA-binding response OmpR family regulator